MSASSLPFNYKPLLLEGAPTRPVARIVIRDADLREFNNKACSTGRYQVEGAMVFYLRDGPENLPGQSFRFEKWHEAEGRKARIETFKGYQTRLYGFAMQANGQRTFFITRLDLAKKDNKAKRRVLDAAGAEAIRILKAFS